MKQHLILLRQILTDRFDEEELRTLCFDMGIDHDDLPGRGKAAKARELVAQLERQERIPDCIEFGKEFRPDVPWVKVEIAWLEAAQREASDPCRFQPLIEELQATVAQWDERVERQRERIATGLDEERQRRAEEQARRHKQERVRVVGQPPRDVVHYFRDRQRELRELTDALIDPTAPLVSVVGHGGMGKTMLACKVLKDVERQQLPYAGEDLNVDGIAYFSTETDGVSLERIFLDCAKLLDWEEQSSLKSVWTNPQLETKKKVAHLLDKLNDGRYVVLLDNLENLLDDRGRFLNEDLQLFFDQALTTTSGVQFVITSRIALAFRPAVMRFDRQVNLIEGLPVDEGVVMLRELDPNGKHGLRDAPEEDLARAVIKIHGIPRALELLCGILAEDALVTLDEVLDTFYKQERVVRDLVEENYRRLDRNGRRVIEALAVFKKPVTVLAVDYLLEPFVPGLDVPSVVQRLTRTNIVSVNRATKTVTLHPIDQDYVYSQLPNENETESDYTRQALECRAADYYVQVRTPEESWESIEDLEPQLNEFEHRVRGEDYDRACRLLGRPEFESLLHRGGHYAKLVEMHERLLNLLTNPRSRALNLSALARAFRAMGEFKQSIDFHMMALDIVREIGDRQLEGANLGSLGRNYYALGAFDRAIDAYEEALFIAREVDDPQEESYQLGSLGTIYREIGEFKKAARFYSEALSIAREIGDRWIEESNLGRQGTVYQRLGKLKKAIQYYQKALTIALEIGLRWDEAFWLGRLGSAYYSLGQFKKATMSYEEGLAVAREIYGSWLEGYHLVGLGRVVLTNGKVLEATGYCESAQALGAPRIGYQATLILAIALLHQDESVAARAFIETVDHCRHLLDKTETLWLPRYTLATALVGQAICNTRWARGNERDVLLTPALEEYHRALEITAAPGVVQDTIRDLELIQAAGIEGLEPVFELLREAEAEPDEELPALYEDLI